MSIFLVDPLIQIADLPAVDRRVEDGGDDVELLGAVVLVAGKPEVRFWR
jgi:hypothetical protein